MNNEANEQFLDYVTEGLNLSNDYFLIFNRDLILVSYNKAVIKTLKHKALEKDILGKDIFFHIPEFQWQWPIEYYINNSTTVDIPLCEDYLVKSAVARESVYTQLRMHLRHDYIIIAATDISKQKQAEDLNRQLKNTVTVLTRLLEEKQNEIEKNCYYNLEAIFFPMLDLLQLKATLQKDEQTATIIETLIANLQTICEPLVRPLIEKLHLTQREIEIANLIRLGKTSKEIADLLNISCKTVNFHRANIRKKMSINNTKDDLRSCLIAMNKSLPSESASLVFDNVKVDHPYQTFL